MREERATLHVLMYSNPPGRPNSLYLIPFLGRPTHAHSLLAGIIFRSPPNAFALLQHSPPSSCHSPCLLAEIDYWYKKVSRLIRRLCSVEEIRTRPVKNNHTAVEKERVRFTGLAPHQDTLTYIGITYLRKRLKDDCKGGVQRQRDGRERERCC